MTPDENFIARLSKETNCREALRLLVENEHLLGYDPYYADLRTALMDMAKRLSTTPESVELKEKE